MSGEALTHGKSQRELDCSIQGKVNLIGVMVGILGLILGSVGGFFAFESAREYLQEETFKLSRQPGRMFEDLSEAEDFATRQYRLKTYLTRVDPISVP